MATKNKKVLITGGSKGIGHAILKKLILEGYTCDVIGRSALLKIESVNHQYYCNLSNKQDVDDLCEILSTKNYDVLINNAGWSHPANLDELDSDKAVRDIQLNLLTPLMLMKVVLKAMKKNNYGRIINISSIAAVEHVALLATYSAAKAGLNSLTCSMAKLVSEYNITVNTIAPGGIDTDSSVYGRKEISKRMDLNEDVYQEKMLEKMGVKHLLTPDSIYALVKLLINDIDKCFNGQKFNICGLLTTS